MFFWSMINYLCRDLRSPLGALHKLVCLVAKMNHNMEEMAAEMAWGGRWRSNVIIPLVSIQAARLKHLLELKVKAQ